MVKPLRNRVTNARQSRQVGINRTVFPAKGSPIRDIVVFVPITPMEYGVDHLAIGRTTDHHSFSFSAVLLTFALENTPSHIRKRKPSIIPSPVLTAVGRYD